MTRETMPESGEKADWGCVWAFGVLVLLGLWLAGAIWSVTSLAENRRNKSGHSPAVLLPENYRMALDQQGCFHWCHPEMGMWKTAYTTEFDAVCSAWSFREIEIRETTLEAAREQKAMEQRR